MKITNNVTLLSLQQAFNQTFPGLRIEFYAAHHDTGEGSPKGTSLDPHLLVKDARTTEQEGTFKLDPQMSVGAFEEALEERFGLNVQVFRKSGVTWMQTTATDHWTLGEQNRKGSASEKHYQEKYY